MLNLVIQNRNLVACLWIPTCNLPNAFYLWVIFQLFCSAPNNSCKNILGLECMQIFKGVAKLGHVGLTLTHPCCISGRNISSSPGNPSLYSSFTEAVTYRGLPQKHSGTCSKSNQLGTISKILFSLISAGVFCSYWGVLVYIRHK